MRRHNLMLMLGFAGLLIAPLLAAQEPASNPQPPPSLVRSEAPATSQIRTITISAGTRIPLALAGPISSKSHPGDSVRAVTGFPVTVGTQLAIPVGTYVQGVIDKVTKGGRTGPTLKMHFTQLLYPNGYSVDMEGASVQAKAHRPNSSSAETAALATPSASYSSLAAPSSPQTPTLQVPTPHTGAIVGVAIAGAAATAALLILGHYHRGGSIVLFDTGWQFEMVLESPLSVDAASVAAATAVTSDK